jgi:hypothetical protein
VESKEYSWAWVTGDRLLTDKPCELVYAHLVPSAASTGTILYNGTGAKGDEVINLVAAGAGGVEFSPPVPVYCEKGLYLVAGSAFTGCFVMWRHL